MKPSLTVAIERLAFDAGADGFTVARASRHAVVIFHFDGFDVRQVLSISPSDQRARLNRRAELRRAIRRAA